MSSSSSRNSSHHKHKSKSKRVDDTASDITKQTPLSPAYPQTQPHHTRSNSAMPVAAHSGTPYSPYNSQSYPHPQTPYMQGAPMPGYPNVPPQGPQGPQVPQVPQIPYPHTQNMPPHQRNSYMPQPGPLSSYDPAFLFSQSSIFASYLQSAQHAQHAQQAYLHYQPQPQHHPHHRHSYSSSSSSKQPPGMMPFSSPVMSVPRGPPRKPKQSGHALWVGNLPPNTTLIELCSLFGTANIQSIFLIQRTLCAFVNYSSESALHEGINVFERRGSSIRGNQLMVKIKTSPREDEDPDEDDDYEDELADGVSASSVEIAKARAQSPDRYFVCKSLTVEDLHASVRLGLWDTQSHNQELFNQAFKTCRNVYLIFSANRAGEYFGYARMMSEIPTTADPNLLAMQNLSLQGGQQSPQQPQSQQAMQFPFYAAAPSVPRLYPTAANSTIPIPAGRIVDDSSRGILFWEVTESVPKHGSAADKQARGRNRESKSSHSKSNKNNNDDNDYNEYYDKKNASNKNSNSNLDSSTANNWTIPFKVQWLSPPGKTVPFSKVRTMRNPYNKNRFLKIARDGTEIEPTVGRKLLELFHV